MNNRIKSSSIQFGESFVLGDDKNAKVESEKIEAEVRQQITARVQTEKRVIIDQANKQAEEIIQQAQAQGQEILEQFKQQGYKEGFDKGYQDGYNKYQNDCAQIIQGLNAVAKTNFELKKEILQSSEKEILELTVAVAEKILKEKINLEPELILGIIKGAISQLEEREEIKILVNPYIAKRIYEYLDNIKQSVNGIEIIKIIEDKTVPIHSALVESPTSRIDARLDAQLAEITKQLITEADKEPLVGELINEETIDNA